MVALKNFITIIFILFIINAQAQNDDSTNFSGFGVKSDFIDYSHPRTYELANIVITGTNFYDKSVLQMLLGLSVGQKIKIPSDDIAKAITNMWKQKLFD